jgi:cytochrome c biogenesis protein CcdA/thiol-disulfide isomerase/thioredoxin
MTLFVVSFIAGVLTVLAPCILPLLPIVIGGSATDAGNRWKPYIITGSLALSVILFTLLLKASTLLIDIPQSFWSTFSGGILILLGITLVFPQLWERLPINNLINRKSQTLLATGSQKKSVWGDVIMGAALGPVFSTCSPTYFVILATVLPASFALGLLYLFAYTLGLTIMLLAIAVLGQKLVGRLTGAADSRGWVKRGMGVLILLVGLAVLLGYDKKIETALLDSGFFDVTVIEQRLLDDASMPNVDETEPMPADERDGPTAEELQQSNVEDATGVSNTTVVAPAVANNGYTGPEITRAGGYLNTDGQPITIGEHFGSKVVLVDFWTYSCINCQRTLPYLTAWYDKYRDQGLEIIGVHTPEFAFERKAENVQTAIEKWGIEYPVVLDNGYHTWTAFGNRYWPRKYLFNDEGELVYDHIGEGAYEETEQAIQAALQNLNASVSTGVVDVDAIEALTPSRVRSPEVYFGSRRNTSLGNGVRGSEGHQSFMFPDALQRNLVYLDGDWFIGAEYAETRAGSALRYRFTAKDVYMVASGEGAQDVEVYVDGERVADAAAGMDVRAGTLSIEGERLYHILELPEFGVHTLELRFPNGVRAYTFTFG